MRHHRPPLLALLWLVLGLATLAATAAAEPSHPTLGPLGEREVTVSNHSKRSMQELYVSPQSADSWGQDLLGDDVLDPGRSTHHRLGRMRECSFDLLAVYDDTSREEMRAVNLCHNHDVTFDGHSASTPASPTGPSRSVTLVNASPLPIQQLYLSPPDAAQWGDDLLTQSALSAGEQRAIDFHGDCIADVRVVFSNRAAEERRGLDLCANPVLTIAPGWTTQVRPDSHD
jgi:hypothetical protein